MTRACRLVFVSTGFNGGGQYSYHDYLALRGTHEGTWKWKFTCIVMTDFAFAAMRCSWLARAESHTAHLWTSTAATQWSPVAISICTITVSETLWMIQIWSSSCPTKFQPEGVAASSAMVPLESLYQNVVRARPACQSTIPSRYRRSPSPWHGTNDLPSRASSFTRRGFAPTERTSRSRSSPRSVPSMRRCSTTTTHKNGKVA